MIRPATPQSLVTLVMGRKNCLSDEELIYIYAKLKVLASFLVKGVSPDQEALMNLRLDLQNSEELVSSRISKSDLAGKEFVEHFNQNDIITCKEIDKLVGKSWM